MTRFFRWQTVAGALASVVMGAIAIAPLPAIALEREEVVRRLGAVPIFTVIREDGRFLVLPPPEDIATPTNSETGVVFNFFDPTDVQGFFTNLRESNPEATASMTILVSSLGDLYEWAERNENEAQRPQLIYAPIEEAVTSATALLRQQGEAVNEFPGIPLFVATSSSEDNYLTLEDNGQTVVPFFFSREDLDRMLDIYRERQPDVAGQAQVKVTTLDRVVSILEEGQATDDFVNRIRLIPSRESLEFIQSIQREAASGNAAPGTGTPGNGGSNTNNGNGGNSGANGGASNLLR
ncbi:MAG: hypothetical protein MH825_09515 [Cyanobacteria bacterium]|nr:hypothetical protein [Cyanobacteriota bacterium]